VHRCFICHRCITTLYPNYDGSFNGRPNGVARWVRKPKIDGLGRDEEVSVLYDDDDDDGDDSDDSDDDTTLLLLHGPTLVAAAVVASASSFAYT